MNLEERLWHWSMCEGRTSTLQHEEEYSSNCHQRTTRQVTSAHVRAVAVQLVRHPRRRTKLGGRAYIDTQRPQVDERDRMPIRVARLHQGRTCRGNRARRRHHNRWRTIGGGISHQKSSREYEIKKQVIGKDADLEKSGRTLDRVIEWGRDGISQ